VWDKTLPQQQFHDALFLKKREVSLLYATSARYNVFKQKRRSVSYQLGVLNLSSDSEKLTVAVKELALNSGASLVGIVSARSIDSFPPVWVGWRIQKYTLKTEEVLPNSKSVIVTGIHVWDDMLELAIRKGDKWVYPEYFPLATLEHAIISYLEKNGFRSVSAYSLSCKRLAQLAGFGNYGKNALITNPVYGPWIRIAPVLTTAELVADKPFEKDLCRDCEACVKACPVAALTPYKVDDSKCLVGIHLLDKDGFERNEQIVRYEPSFSKNAHLMCMECQKACKYGRVRTIL